MPAVPLANKNSLRCLAFAACALLAVLGCVAALSAAAQTASTAPPRVLEVHLDGMVHPISAEFINSAIEEANTHHYSLVLIQLSTPGGLESSMRDIISKIISSEVPVAAYVAPSGSRAASAGFFILLSADVAAMAPGTNTGAAHPVMLGGTMDDVMKQKVENDSAAYMRTLTSKRGRNIEMAEKGVRESKSYTEDEALKGKLIDVIASDRDDLLRKLDGFAVTRFNGSKQVLHLDRAQVDTYDASFRQSFLSRIADPNVAFILLILGLLGLYVEFTHPGAIIPGVAGGILAVLGLFAISILPVNWAGAALIGLAIVFFVLEAKFVSHGVLAAGGVLSMILGALMLINTHLPGASITLTTALSVAVPFGLITVFLLRLVMRSREMKVVTGDAGMIGKIGRVEVPLTPAGKVFVQGELWDAVSSAPAARGTLVRVKDIDGLTLTVEPVGGAATDSDHASDGNAGASDRAPAQPTLNAE